MKMISKKKSCNMYWLLYILSFSVINVSIYMKEEKLLTSNSIYILVWNVGVIAVALAIFLKKIVKPLVEKYALRSVEIKYSDQDIKYYWIVMVSQIICWLPVFLAYYPGLFAYDVAGQIPQKIGSYSTHHPLAHTLYLQFFYYCIGKKMGYTTGIAIATIVQMIIFSMMMSYIHLYLYRVGCNKVIRYVLIALIGILPIYSLIAIAMTKDVIFTGCVGVCFVSLCYYYNDYMVAERRKSYGIIYIISIIGTILFRNNGIFPIFFSLILIAMDANKNKRKQLLLYTLIGIGLGIMCSLSLKFILQAESGSKNEALSLPYQQIACAYINNKEQMSEEQITQVLAVLPDADRYVPYLADPVKYSAKGTENWKQFVSIYAKMGLKYPKSYLEAFIKLNAGYLGITDYTFAEIYGKENRQGVLLTDTKEGFRIEHRSYLPKLEQLYEYLFTENEYKNMWAVNLLLSPAFYFWIVMLLLIYAICIRNKRTIVPFVFLLTLILTLFAGPCSLIRYALPFIVCIAPLATCVFNKTEVGSK